MPFQINFSLTFYICFFESSLPFFVHEITAKKSENPTKAKKAIPADAISISEEPPSDDYSFKRSLYDIHRVLRDKPGEIFPKIQLIFRNEKLIKILSCSKSISKVAGLANV